MTLKSPLANILVYNSKILIEMYYGHFEYHHETQLGIEKIRHTTKNNGKHNKIN
jgi:hypothetical protein